MNSKMKLNINPLQNSLAKFPSRISEQNSNLLLRTVAGEDNLAVLLVGAGPACRDAGLQDGSGDDRAFDRGDGHIPAIDRGRLGLLLLISGVVFLREGGLLGGRREA